MLPTRLSVRSPALALLLAIAACGGEQEEGPERKTAAGEVLGGSISDAMLPLDTAQSQSPPLRESAGEGTDDAEDGGTRDGAKEAQPAATSSASPAAAADASPSAAPAAED